ADSVHVIKLKLLRNDCPPTVRPKFNAHKELNIPAKEQIESTPEKTQNQGSSITAVASISIKKSGTARENTPIHVATGRFSAGKNSRSALPIVSACSGL